MRLCSGGYRKKPVTLMSSDGIGRKMIAGSSSSISKPIGRTTLGNSKFRCRILFSEEEEERALMIVFGEDLLLILIMVVGRQGSSLTRE